MLRILPNNRHLAESCSQYNIKACCRNEWTDWCNSSVCAVRLIKTGSPASVQSHTESPGRLCLLWMNWNNFTLSPPPSPSCNEN